jgi:mevalonate kinase
MAAGLASQVPARSVAAALGMKWDKALFFQIAATMPAELQPKLDLVAQGKASGADILALMMGGGAAILGGSSFNPDIK